jgi:hypothetical protein
MPSTYTNNGGLELPGDGEQSGDWGDTVNTNMQILDAITNGQVTLTLDGTSSSLTTSNAPTLSSGQNALIILSTGTISATHTITIDPNDAEKIYFVYNTTAYSVVFTQGSGGNITMASGTSGIIYANGGGASAKVSNLTDYFAMSNVKITGGTIVTSSATITGGSITGITDLAVADGGTGASDAATARTNLGAQAIVTGAASTVTASDLTASRAAVSNASGKIDVSSVTTTELSYVSGVTSAIQTQLGTKAPSISPTLSGTITVNGGTQSWTAIASGTNLTFAYNGVNKFRIDSSGNITVTGNVTAYGTIT